MELLFRERTVVIRNRGSVQFAVDELGSDIVLVDVRCEALGGTNYHNTKSLPPYGFYGTVTLFGGATVKERIPLEFVYQRVIDFESIYRRTRCYLTKIEEMVQFIGDTVSAPNNAPPAGGEPRDSFEYRGLGITKLKINSERPAQWTVTVRAYTENDLQCESVVSSDDPTNGEPEYPSPTPIPPGGEFPAGLPDPDAPYPGADPNDFPPAIAPGAIIIRLEGMASTGSVGYPDACTLDAQVSENVRWDNPGPPPYTAQLGDGTASCRNLKLGLYVINGNGERSPLYYGGTGFGSGNVAGWNAV